MTTSQPLRTPAPASAALPPARPPLVSRPLLLRFVTVVGASASFFLLLSVVPLYATASGGDAGLATGALMLATVCGELATPRLVARFGYRSALAAGLLLLGAPALFLTAWGGMGWIVAVCCLRGLGFALTVVAGGALTAALIPAERRGEGLALVGVVSGVPSLLALPLGVWLADRSGYLPVSLLAGLLALAVIPAVPGLPGREEQPADEGAAPQRRRAGTALARAVRTLREGGRRFGRGGSVERGSAGRRPGDHGSVEGGSVRSQSGERGASGGRRSAGRQSGDRGGSDKRQSGERGGSVWGGLRDGGLLRPAGVFTVTALGAGIVVTFLPLAVPADATGVVAAALFVQPAAATATRWFAGRLGDRHGPGRLVLPGLLLSAAGLLLTAATGSTAAVLCGVAVFGAGFGVAQNATLSLMYSRVSRAGYSTVSALWNVGYDAGMGAGAVGFGALAAATGYPAAFALTAAAMLLAFRPARRA
ncbi:MFS transporter [Actinacidiphila bryophytorum]|uniref:MFS transporter n=1 Tax=Actinacidiphila bryophytorum TaxID=1436133 RepID=UPI002176A134|nr:MFS transporter [Actinacidiphila bryophytorum]UWE10622.1 MFS transporter [Actinacidiphila bryophytorum]